MPTYSSSTTAKRYREDVPNAIQKKIGLLCDQERHIAALETQLNQFRSQRERLEKELEPYRIQIHSAVPQTIAVTPAHDTRCPIHRLPNELLHLIFEFIVHGIGSSHRHSLGRLLRICRRWYNLVMHSPSLWACIDIFDPMLFFRVRERQAAIQYIEACLLRSQSLLLDIYLEFDELNASDYIKVELYDYAEALVDQDEHNYIFDKIYSEQWEFNSPAFQSKLDHFLRCLLGEDGQHVKRWQTLVISLPPDEMVADLVWLRMAPTMVNLSSIGIFDAPSSWSTGEALAKADLSNVNTLTLRGRDPGFNFTFHLLNVSSTLTSLDIEVGGSVTNLEGLSSLQHLRLLNLECSGPSSQMSDQDSVTPLFSLRLPRLNQLTLVGYYNDLRKIRFELPALKKLSIRADNARQRLPTLSPSSVEWRLGYIVRRKVVTEVVALVSLIRDVLLLSQKTRRITIPKAEKAEFLEQIQQCRLEGAKISLSEIVVEENNQDPEIIDVTNLI
jgi:hypothetical protein